MVSCNRQNSLVGRRVEPSVLSVTCTTAVPSCTDLHSLERGTGTTASTNSKTQQLQQVIRHSPEVAETPWNPGRVAKCNAQGLRRKPERKQIVDVHHVAEWLCVIIAADIDTMHTTERLTSTALIIILNTNYKP